MDTSLDEEVANIVGYNHAQLLLPLSEVIGYDNRYSPEDRNTMFLARSLKDKDREMLYDSSPNASPIPGIVIEEEDFFRNEPGRLSTGRFKGHRSRSEDKLHSLDYKNTKMAKRESLKVQKRNYRREKKRATNELLSTLKDPSVVIMSGWLKIRGMLKGWTKLWCVLKPGLVIVYKSSKHGQWVGTVLLNTCELIERPSRKDGFCFKLFHPLDQSIWHLKGPKGETFGSVTVPLPSSYLIFRAHSEADGKCWMDALELALRCSTLLVRTMTREQEGDQALQPLDLQQLRSSLTEHNNALNESEIENKHFRDQGLDEPEEDRQESKSESESEQEDMVGEIAAIDHSPSSTTYILNESEELGLDTKQTETLEEENKSIVWSLIKQVRPGMDLARVVLPTFILEPRSWLDKLSDFYYHSDLLTDAAVEDDAFNRMKQVVRWYLSGFYKKPKGLKKPYNPVLGETFRCLWENPRNKSKTFYIAEQVSHHPPVSAFYITNRKDGFCISGSILCKSKFYGNSVAAVLDGTAKLTILTRGEDYLITMPYAYCKGILYGTLTMEYGGKVSIECEKTGYKTELEFKLKPFLRGNEYSNQVTGKIKLGKETLASLDGKWDGEVVIKDRRTDDVSLFWNVTKEVQEKRLKRSTVALEEQAETESEKLWVHVTEAIAKCDQNDATKEKTILEEEQRKGQRERKAKMVEWLPQLFERDLITGEWVYKHVDARPWDPRNDIEQTEFGGVIRTVTRHRTPLVRTTSINSLVGGGGSKFIRHPVDKSPLTRGGQGSRRLVVPMQDDAGDSEMSTPEEQQSDYSTDDEVSLNKKEVRKYQIKALEQVVQPLHEQQQINCQQILKLGARLEKAIRDQQNSFLSPRDWCFVVLLLFIQVWFYYMFK